MPGYSGTPLAKKLGLAPGLRVGTKNAPANWGELVAPLPDGVVLVPTGRKDLDVVHFFTTSRAELRRELERQIARLKPNGALWISWPKKASGVKTDVTEDVIREEALPRGLVDVKVCAVDDVWSGLKLVVRKELRGKGGRAR